ncbi:MAG: hypothetical protein JNK05_01955 [Myxococcales bacterium]|nr:hypothetical protein [Myxococcales bacterium]
MKIGVIRRSYWALDPVSLARVERIAVVEQASDGSFAPVFTTDPRPIDATLELLADGDWREVRARRLDASNEGRILPSP